LQSLFSIAYWLRPDCLTEVGERLETSLGEGERGS